MKNTIIDNTITVDKETYDSLPLHEDQFTPLKDRSEYGSSLRAVRQANEIARDDAGEYSYSEEFVFFKGRRGLKKTFIQFSTDWTDLYVDFG